MPMKVNSVKMTEFRKTKNQQLFKKERITKNNIYSEMSDTRQAGLAFCTCTIRPRSEPKVTQEKRVFRIVVTGSENRTVIHMAINSHAPCDMGKKLNHTPSPSTPRNSPTVFIK